MNRTIAAILASDVAGYSRLMAQDEEDTLRRLAAAKAVFRQHVAAFRGRVFNTAGDAILAEFPSGVEALRAALAIQADLDALDRDDPPARRVRFRMGLTIGDVVEVDGDLLGDGVNVAARLEGLAEPGGICLSRTLHEAVSGKVPVTFKDIGPQKLKNIPRPVHAFRVGLPGVAARPATRSRRAEVLRWGSLAAVVLGTGLGALLLIQPAWIRGTVTEAVAGRDDLISVSVARARQACFPDRVRLTGILTPRRAQEVRPEAEGMRVVRVAAQNLDTVKAGQVLAELARAGEPDSATLPLRSPMDGLVTRSAAMAGMPVSPRGPALFELAADSAFDLDAEAPLATLGRLQQGQGVGVTPLGGSERPGRIRLVAASIDPATQLGRVRINVTGSEGLRPGQYATGVVRVGERCGLAAPHAAVAQEAEGPVIFLANSGRIEARPVTTGLSTESEIEIREGLDERDTIVTKAAAFLREGDRIRPVIQSSSGR